MEPETSLTDLFPLSSDYSIPIAVCSNGKLLGVVPRVSLLKTMSRPEEEANANA
ncbi:MAG: hypothetical protein U5Q44_03560 [Dehalococcoidia bacterium]|nr:hypothetical protein [Dehalococcoidia bacterium]